MAKSKPAHAANATSTRDGKPTSKPTSKPRHMAASIMLPSPHRALVAIDWADRNHAICIWDAQSGKIEQRMLPSTPEALHTFVAELRQRFATQTSEQADAPTIGILYEAHMGPLSVMLAGQPGLVIYEVNPKSAARFREAFNVSGGYHLLQMGLHHLDALTPQLPYDAQSRLLGMLSEQRRKLVDERTRHTNELRSCLKSCFPQMIEMVSDLSSPLCKALLEKWPTLQALKQAKPEAVRKFFYAHNSRRKDVLEERLKSIREAVVLTDERAHLSAMQMRVSGLLDMIAVLGKHIARHDEQLAVELAKHPDAQVILSVPGAGACLAPRVIAVLGTDRRRWASAEELADATGVSPVIRASGQEMSVQARYQCDKFARQSFVELANCSRIAKEPWVVAYYQMRQSHGWHHNRIVRALAYKWQRIIWKMWQTGQRYDAAKLSSPYANPAAAKPQLGIQPKSVQQSSKLRRRAA